MRDNYRDIKLSEAGQFAFLKTLIGDPYLGNIPVKDPNAQVATIYATQNSPDEVKIEYGEKNSLGLYGCHVFLKKDGSLSDRNCFGVYDDGTYTLAGGVSAKEAKEFLSKYSFSPRPKATFTMPPVLVNGTPPMPSAGTFIFPRAQVTIENTPLESIFNR